MDIDIQAAPNSINMITLQKMTLIYNALENGWSIKKRNNCYVFKKKHNNEKKIYLDNYLKRFMIKNMDINTIIDDYKE